MTRRHLGISASARLLAAVDISLADTIIAVWDGKYHYGWWRPITAIREAETDGNPDTAASPMDAASGHAPLPGLAERPVRASSAPPAARSNGSTPAARSNLTITSMAAEVTRHYDAAADIREDAIDARLGRYPLPHRRQGRRRPRRPSGELGAKPLLRASAIEPSSTREPGGTVRPAPRRSARGKTTEARSVR